MESSDLKNLMAGKFIPTRMHKVKHRGMGKASAFTSRVFTNSLKLRCNVYDTLIGGATLSILGDGSLVSCAHEIRSVSKVFGSKSMNSFDLLAK